MCGADMTYIQVLSSSILRVEFAHLIPRHVKHFVGRLVERFLDEVPFQVVQSA